MSVVLQQIAYVSGGLCDSLPTKNRLLRNGTGEPAMKIYKNKCRYCGGDLEMFTHRSRSFDGSKIGYVTTLFCHGCAGALFDFSENEDDIPNAEKRLLESYGIKGNDNESGNN